MAATQVYPNTQFPSFYHRQEPVKFLESFSLILKSCPDEHLNQAIHDLFSLAVSALTAAQNARWSKFDAPTGGNRCQLAACMVTLLARDPSLPKVIETALNKLKCEFTNASAEQATAQQPATDSLLDFLMRLCSKSKQAQSKVKEIWKEDSDIIKQYEQEIPHHLLFLILNYILASATKIDPTVDEKGIYFAKRQLEYKNMLRKRSQSTSTEAQCNPTDPKPAKKTYDAHVTGISYKLALHIQTWINQETAAFMKHQFQVSKAISFPDQSLLEKLSAIGRTITGKNESNVIVKRRETPFFLVTEMVFAAIRHYQCPLLLKVRPLSKEKSSIDNYVYQKLFILERGVYQVKDFDPNLNEAVLVIEAFSHLSPEELENGEVIDNLLLNCGNQGILDFIKFSAAKHPQFTTAPGEKPMDLTDLLNEYSSLESLKERYGHLAQEAVNRQICREVDFSHCCIQHIYCDRIGMSAVPSKKVIIHA